MFGIGGGELLFILIIILMFFGSDKIPDIARTLGRGMAQLKNATNDIKSEISKGMAETGVDPNSLTGGITDEIAKAKEGFTKMVMDSGEKAAVNNELDQIREKFAQLNQSEIEQARRTSEPEIPQAASKVEPSPDELPSDGPIKRKG